MEFKLRHIFTPTLLGTVSLIFFIFASAPIRAQFYGGYYEEDIYLDNYDGYAAYESNVQDAFAASNPTASSPSQIRGRQNMWGEDGYGEDENLHPSDPLPLGDHTILFVLAAITAMVIFLQQRKRKALNTTGAKTLFVLFGLFLASNSLFAQSDGDLRIQYVEQILEGYEDPSTHQQKNHVVRIYTFNSETFKLANDGKPDTLSIHIFNMIDKNGKDHVNNPEVILQQYNGSKWVDIECHMVFGPLRGNAGIGLLPGRKNAADDSNVDDFLYDDGIEKIKKDQTYADKGYRASGVWNFVVTKKDGKATFDMTQVHRYDGPFYVRVNGEDNKNNANLLTLSEYAYEHIYEEPIGALKPHDYTHYACKYLSANSNVMFTIATKHSPRIAPELLVKYQRYSSDLESTMLNLASHALFEMAQQLCPEITDPYVKSESGGSVALLPADASVRFSWDIMTNRLTRAYVGDTKTPEGEYLVAHGNNQTPEPRHHFQDNTNWMYSVDVGSRKDTKIVVRAKFNGQNQFIWGKAIDQGSPVLSGSNDGRIYKIRLIYDFKDHRLVTIYQTIQEDQSEETDTIVNLETPVMILREHNGDATQLTFPTNADKIVDKAVANGTAEDKYTNPAYAVLTFLEDKFATTDQHGNDNSSVSHYEKMFYWVSFPFDVNIKDIFGLGEYGEYWAIQYYNGAKRAAQGLPEGTTGWEYVAETKEEADTKTLYANQGYVVCLNYKRLSKDYGYEAGRGRKVSLYFPSADLIGPEEISNQDNITVNLKEHTIGDRIAWNHWNWHLIGIPSFANPGFEHPTQTDAPFFYEYDHAYDGYGPRVSSDMTFRAMHAYIFQYAGDINWTGIVNITPKSIAARQTEEDPITLRLELIHGDRTHDKTFIQLRDDKGTEGFDLNLDLTKMLNKGANIYSVVNGDQMAGNAVPREESIIPLGVVITEAGDYTFAMPEGTNGVNVELIDYETGISTPLTALNYTVNLGAGCFDNRFAVRIQPDKVSTGVEEGEVQLTNGNAQKLIIDGALYLVKDGVLYDAQGKLVR